MILPLGRPIPPPTRRSTARPALRAHAGLLSSLTSTFTDLGLDVKKAEIGGKGDSFHDTFWVVTTDGQKVRRLGAAGGRRVVLLLAGWMARRACSLHTPLLLALTLLLAPLPTAGERRGAAGDQERD